MVVPHNCCILALLEGQRCWGIQWYFLDKMIRPWKWPEFSALYHWIDSTQFLCCHVNKLKTGSVHSLQIPDAYLCTQAHDKTWEDILNENLSRWWEFLTLWSQHKVASSRTCLHEPLDGPLDLVSVFTAGAPLLKIHLNQSRSKLKRACLRLLGKGDKVVHFKIMRIKNKWLMNSFLIESL